MTFLRKRYVPYINLPCLLALLVNLISPLTLVSVRASDESRLDTLKPDQVVQGFTTKALYLNEAGAAMGGRFIHQQTGFTLDLIQIESVPQALIWVNTPPISDRGEPHTQEHLLIGKGNQGRSLTNLLSMSLAEDNAFTMQRRTVFQFNTLGGIDVFSHIFAAHLKALLHPDYTDEEVRREVHHFGVVEDSQTKKLALVERGTAYNEVLSYARQQNVRVYRAMNRILYGEGNPLSFEQGGLPGEIGKINAAGIRTYHEANYQLSKMGMIGAFPPSEDVGELLQKFNGILNAVQDSKAKKTANIPDRQTENLLPSKKPDAAVKIVEYPAENPGQSSLVLLAWPADLEFTEPSDRILLECFIAAFASDTTSNLYRLFIDSQTRAVDLGASSVGGFLNEDPGHPVFIELNDVAASNINQETLNLIRQKIMNELARIASLPGGSAELREFNDRIKTQLIAYRRNINRFVDSPPQFGFRNTDAAWLTNLDWLRETGQFKRYLTFKPYMDEVERTLISGGNIWAEKLGRWGFIKEQPAIVAGRANPKLIKEEFDEQQARARAEVLCLEKLYNVADEQAALRHYQQDYEQASQELDSEAKRTLNSYHFIENPPLTLDDNLKFNLSGIKVAGLKQPVPLFTSTFQNMTGASVGIALSIDRVSDHDLLYLDVLPLLLTEVGVISDKRPISYIEMREQLRQQILRLNAYYSTGYRSGRAELVVTAEGTNLEEAKNSFRWIKDVLIAPDLRTNNLIRIRDVIDHALTSLRNTTQSGEESWVGLPAEAYWRQDDSLYLSIRSFLTATHNVQRLRWLLKDAGPPEERRLIAVFLLKMAQAGKITLQPEQSRRQVLRSLLAAIINRNSKPPIPEELNSVYLSFQRLPEDVKGKVIEAAKDVELTLTDIPDDSLAQDWSYLFQQIRSDLLVSPDQVLAEINLLRQKLLAASGARIFMASSPETRQRLSGDLEGLAAITKEMSVPKEGRSKTRMIDARYFERTGKVIDSPRYVGLVTGSIQNAVITNATPFTSYWDTDRDSLLNYFTVQMFGGTGEEGLFAKTWAAGLAYNSGLRTNLATGRFDYYADRVPSIPQTLSFVVSVLSKSNANTVNRDYILSQIFKEGRAALNYSTRTEWMAMDLADGITPELVSKFRRSVLDVSNDSNLKNELLQREARVYGQVLPGMNSTINLNPKRFSFVIGPEKQISAYETYLQSLSHNKVHRLFPRDFWQEISVAGSTP